MREALEGALADAWSRMDRSGWCECPLCERVGVDPARRAARLAEIAATTDGTRDAPFRALADLVNPGDDVFHAMFQVAASQPPDAFVRGAFELSLMEAKNRDAMRRAGEAWVGHATPHVRALAWTARITAAADNADAEIALVPELHAALSDDEEIVQVTVAREARSPTLTRALAPALVALLARTRRMTVAELMLDRLPAEGMSAELWRRLAACATVWRSRRPRLESRCARVLAAYAERFPEEA